MPGTFSGVTPRLDANAIVFVEAIGELLGVGSPEFVNEVLATSVHEMTHSFYLEHICGMPDLSGDASCAMNYSDPVMRFNGDFVRLQQDGTLCARHIVAIRKAKGYGGQHYP